MGIFKGELLGCDSEMGRTGACFDNEVQVNLVQVILVRVLEV
jgi:hypothetical protein